MSNAAKGYYLGHLGLISARKLYGKFQAAHVDRRPLNQPNQTE
ncbi:hypothetical protein [Picosynechococcus sp. PCC 7003]|nr:hypothetical protein [Picosynechococcus sp. PCC 7003]